MKTGRRRLPVKRSHLPWRPTTHSTRVCGWERGDETTVELAGSEQTDHVHLSR